MRGRIPTQTGFLDLEAPDASAVALSDIARSLASQGRYLGHTRDHYSVAEHCVRLSALVEDAGADRLVQAAALLHDVEEAFLGDIPAPRLALGVAAGVPLDHSDNALALRRQFFERFGLPGEWADLARSLPLVHEYDLRIRADEIWTLFPGHVAWAVGGVEPIGAFSGRFSTWAICWEPRPAAAEFLRRAHMLGLEG